MARKPVTDLSAWPSLTLEGNLIAPAMVAAIAAPRDDEETRQSYRIRRGLSIRDEVSTAFRVGQSHFDAFRKQDNPSSEATRRFMRDFLAETLGFDDLASHEGAVCLLAGGRVPIVVTPPSEEKLDRRSPTLSIDRSRSAAFALQDYLNAHDDALWGIATNGTVLRLLRDNASLTRPAYIEADLAQIFTNEDAASFSILWLLCHRTRFGLTGAPATDCALERWRDTGSKEGEAARDRLAEQVKLALKLLGSGFLEANPDLAKLLHSGDIPLTGWFNELLRLVYRLIFLMVAEDRNLLHPAQAPVAARKLYAEGYSLTALRSLCTRAASWDRHHDRFEGVKIAFRALASGEDALALPALGGLFAVDQLPHLGTARLRNRAFMEALYCLSWLTDEKKSGMVPVNWRAMETEELGSVYESLLELQPQLGSDGRSLLFASDAAEQKGNQRKTTGSYYTPDSLVQTLLDSALDPVLDKTESEAADPAEALLKLTVIDPACGSGHFLLAAARRIATRLARIRAEGTPSQDDFRHALRDVTRCCIHGVDRNPMAVELTKVALWIETVDPGLPLGFLDHHVVCGDALLGLTDLRQLENGIPDAAFTALSGDDKKLCTELKKQNKAARKQLDDLRSGQDLLSPPGQPDALGKFSALEALPESSPEEIAAKEAAWLTFLTQSRTSPLTRAADVFAGAFLSPKPTGSTPPDTRALAAALFPAKATPELTSQIEEARQLCGRDHANVLHWPLAFPKVFARGGFDCILGNPPWERIKLQEEEFFATREPLIATAKNKAERAKRIQWLSEGSLHYHLSQFQSPATPNPVEIQLFRDFEKEKRLAEASSIFAHVDGKEGGRYPLTGVGDVNTYALFAETISQLIAKEGRAGFIVPTGIATDDSTKRFFSALVQSRRVTSLFDFVNTLGFFPTIDRQIKFCLFTIGAAAEGEFASFLTEVAQLADPRRRFRLTTADFEAINPNTKTCPVFRTFADAELTRSIYRRVPVLIEERREKVPEKNPWSIRFATMFHMANDSGLFHSQPADDQVPLYEAKMIHQFDHRWAGYGSSTGNGDDDSSGTLTVEQKQDNRCMATPRYWVDRSAVDWRLLDEAHPLYPLFHARLEKCRDSLAWWFRSWLWGHELLAQQTDKAAFLRKEMDDARMASHDVMELAMKFDMEKDHAEKMAHLFPLKPAEQSALWEQIHTDKGLHITSTREYGRKSSDELSEHWLDIAESILPSRDRRWLMGWRDISKAANERTVIASVIPRAAVGNNLPLMLFADHTGAHQCAALLGNLCAMALDFVARHKVGGTHLNFFLYKQLPILPPEAYSEADLAYIVPRVLELTYTAHDLRPWAEDVIHSYQRQFPQHPPLVPDPAHPQPYRFDPDRRAQLRADLDALYARLYGLTRDELRYILDPADTHGPDYPTETFRVLKTNEQKQFGEYRTRRLVLEAWDRQAALDAEPPSESNLWYVSPTFTEGKGLNRFLLNPLKDKVKSDGDFGEKTFLARLSHAESDVPSRDERPRTFLRFEAFSEGWFANHPPPEGEIPWADEEAFLRYYETADLYQLEMETIASHSELFPSLSIIHKHTVAGDEPASWFRIRVAGPRGGAPITAVVPLQLFQNLLTEGTALTLADIEHVDDKTQRQLDRAVSTQHIASAGDEDLQRVFQGLIHQHINWAVVYDVGQGNAIGLCDQRGGVRCYIDLGGGSGANLRTFPPALQTFCFTQNPPIILTHWDEDHWSSGLRDRRALAQRWIAPRQRMGAIQMAFVAAIISAGGRVLFVDAGLPSTRFGQLQLELCTGSGRNHSGIAVTLHDDAQGGDRRMLFPGDADYRYIPSSNRRNYLSVVAPHHGGPLQQHTAPPNSPQNPESRLVYSYGPSNTYRHPVFNTRVAHDAAGWRDATVNQPGVEVRETAHRAPSGLGHVLLGWQVHSQPPPQPCGGHCHLQVQQI